VRDRMTPVLGLRPLDHFGRPLLTGRFAVFAFRTLRWIRCQRQSSFSALDQVPIVHNFHPRKMAVVNAQRVCDIFIAEALNESRMADEHCSGRTACFNLKSSMNMISFFIEVTKVIHYLPDGFMDLRANDERQLLTLIGEGQGIMRPPVTMHQFRNIGALQFYDMK